MQKHVLYLTETNLRILIKKLDAMKARRKSKPASAILKTDVAHEKFPQSMRIALVLAVDGDPHQDTADSKDGAYLVRLSRTTIKMLQVSLRRRSPGLTIEIGELEITALSDEAYCGHEKSSAVVTSLWHENQLHTVH